MIFQTDVFYQSLLNEKMSMRRGKILQIFTVLHTLSAEKWKSMGIMKIFIGKMISKNEKMSMRRGKILQIFAGLHILSAEKWKSMGIMKHFLGKMVWINEIEIIRIRKMFWYV